MRTVALRGLGQCFVVVIVLCAGIAPVSNAQAESNPMKLDSASAGLNECLADKRQMSVLWLIDQSRSLRKTDQFGIRAIPLETTLRLIDSLRNAETGLKSIKVSIAGFGSGVSLRQPWIEISDSNRDSVAALIREQGTKNDDSLTQYDVALSETLEIFGQESVEDTCKLMLWFSDGQHDQDDKPQINSLERQQIEKTICGIGGLADQLRLEQVRMWAIGFNPDPSKVELMHLISENDGKFELSGTRVSQGGCGSEPAIGKYISIDNEDELADIIDVIPGFSEDPPITLGDCGIGNCSSIKFEASQAVSGFRVRVTRPSRDTRIEVAHASRESTTVFEADEVSGEIFEPQTFVDGPLTVIQLTSNDALVIANGSETGELAGLWEIRFLGIESSEAVGRISFEGRISLALVDEMGDATKVIDRFDTKPLTISVFGGSGKEPLIADSLEVRLGRDPSVVLEPEAVSLKSAGQWTVLPQVLQQQLKSTFASSGALEISVVPQAFVEGLVTERGKRVPIVFPPSAITLGITNGSGYPSYVPDPDLAEVEVNDRDEFTIDLKFEGPDGVDGEVRLVGLSSEFSNDKEFSISAGGFDTQACIAKAGVETTCSFRFKPGKNGYGSLNLPLVFELTSPKAENGPQQQIIETPIFMTRDPNVGKGIRNAIFLIAAFLLIQLLLRYLNALGVSAFQALDGTSRKVRIPIKVRSDGSVTGVSGGELQLVEAGSPDNTFASEFLKKQRSFSVFGYDFTSSVARVFMRPMSQSVGLAQASGKHVFGSLSSLVPKPKRTGQDFVRGGVDLALRRQWILAMGSSQANQLALTGEDVDAEVVAFLDPFEIRSAEEQILDLQTSLMTGGFPGHLEDLLSRIRESNTSEGDLGSEIESSATNEDRTQIADDPHDPFADPLTAAPMSLIESEVNPGVRRGWRRRSRGADDETDLSVSTSPAMDDPFADPFS